MLVGANDPLPSDVNGCRAARRLPGCSSDFAEARQKGAVLQTVYALPSEWPPTCSFSNENDINGVSVRYLSVRPEAAWSAPRRLLILSHRVQFRLAVTR